MIPETVPASSLTTSTGHHGTSAEPCPPTRAYVQRRTNQGLSKLDIMRCLKRYIAREVYHHLTSLQPITPTTCPK